MAALSLSPPLQWTWWLPWPAITGEEHLGKLLLMNTQWLVTCSVLREKPSWNNADGFNVHGVQRHTQFGTSAGMPLHLWVKSTVTSPSDTHPRCWDRGKDRLTGSTGHEGSLHRTGFKTALSQPEFLQVWEDTFVDRHTIVNHTLGFPRQRKRDGNTQRP